MKNLSAFLAGCLVLSAAVAKADCSLDRGIYQDLDGNGFTLEFSDPSGEPSDALYAVAIRHPQRGVVFDFDFRYSNGYVEALLVARDEDENEAYHRLHFFDRDFTSIPPAAGDFAPAYALAEGLGYADYYGTGDQGQREPALGTPMWRFARCKAAGEKTTAVPTPAGQPTAAEPGRLSSAERREDDGRISAYGYVSDLRIKDGRWYLSIDYVEWLSQEECQRRVRAGVLDWDAAECEAEVRIVNTNPELRKFALGKSVAIIIKYPERPVSTLSPQKLSEVWHAPSDETAELREGLWQILRRGNVVERLEWVYVP